MRITVAGTGYVGLVAGVCFAELGNHVICCDIDSSKVEQLNRGETPIYEPGLEPLLRRNLAEERISFTTDLSSSIAQSEVAFIAVGTPSASTGEADIGQVLAIAGEIGRAMRGPLIVVIKSTVPVGTADQVRRAIAAETRLPFTVVSNPEFLKEGDAVNDFTKPNRVIIGTEDRNAQEVMRRLYEPFVHAYDRIIWMDNRSAELTKYAANAMLALRISFMNEMANLCDKLGADVDLVRRGVGTDPRIGPKFLFPGPGFGGSCFPKDLRALVAISRNVDMELASVGAAIKINEGQRDVVYGKLATQFQGSSLRGRRLTVWGLAYKPNTDDVRESPAIALVQRLVAEGARVVVRDPAATAAARKVLGDTVEYAENDYPAVEGAEALVLMTEWREFRTPDFARIKSLMANPVLVDARNIWNREHVRSLGFTYCGIGRG